MAVLIDDSLLNSLITQINECQKANGGQIEIPPVDVPGLGNILLCFIRTVEKGFITTFEPILELKELITEYLIKPVEFIAKIAEFAARLAELIADPITFIINEIVLPISENINIPLSLDLSIIMDGLPTVDIDTKFLELDSETIALIQTMLTTDYYSKLMAFMLMPIKLIIGIFTGFIQMLVDAIASPLTKIAELVIGVITDFPGTIMNLITDILADILLPILESIVPGGFNDVAALVESIKALIIDVLTGEVIDIDSYRGGSDEEEDGEEGSSSDFDKVFGFINIVACFAKGLFSFITMFPVLFLVELVRPMWKMLKNNPKKLKS